MSRLLPAFLLGLLICGDAPAQCGYPIRWYPLGPSVWGAPAPKPLPPAPFVPKAGVGVQEEEAPAPVKPAEKPKDKDVPLIPKTKLPVPDPDEPDGKKSPKKDAPKKEPTADAGKAVEQYFVPADRKRSESPAEVRVGFFNHSEREIVLEINGEAIKLPSAQYVTLRLKRTFTWAEKGQKGSDVVVPPDADGIEIVFRK